VERGLLGDLLSFARTLLAHANGRGGARTAIGLDSDIPVVTLCSLLSVGPWPLEAALMLLLFYGFKIAHPRAVVQSSNNNPF
jgi:hypothetical protein